MAKTTALPYEGFNGPSLIPEIAARGDVESLATIWQLGDPQLCVTLLPHMLNAQDERLALLVAQELVNRSLPGPFPPTLTQQLAQTEDLPPLPVQTVTALLEVLAKPDGLDPAIYEPARPDATRWVLRQRSAETEAYANNILDRSVPGAENESVRQAARVLVAGSSEAFHQAADSARERLTATPSEQAWLDTEALFAAGSEAGRSHSVLNTLGEQILQQAPLGNSSGQFVAAVKEFAQGDGSEVALSTLASDAAGGPGMQALTAAGLSDESPRKLEFFAAVAQHRPELWPVAVNGADDWSEPEWRRRVASLTAPISAEAARWVIGTAPVRVLKRVIELMISEAEATGESGVLEEVGARIAEHRKLLGEVEAAEAVGDHDGDEPPEDLDLLQATPWAAAKGTDTLLHLGVVLGAALAPQDQAQLIAHAFAKNRLRPAAAASLVPSGHEHVAFLQLDPGAKRGELCAALLQDRHDETLLAVTQVQQEAFGVDLVQAVVGEDTEIAFAGGADAYASLTHTDRDTLVSLLEQFGTSEQMPLLEVAMGDGHTSATQRRIRAANRAGELISPRGVVPTQLVLMLGSGKPALRQTAIRNIEKIHPRDEAVISQLRTLASEGGVPGNLSSDALDVIANDIIDDLGSEPDQSTALLLLPLLGRTGRTCSFETLFRFVGEEALWDDVAVRRVAAEAISDAAEDNKDISLDDQTALVELIDGDGGEVDPEALNSLNHARSRVLLGDDEALTILYNDFLPPKTPVADPDTLFGGEKPTIVTHLGLFSEARAAHARGRQLTQLDIVAAALARAAYLHYGLSDPVKAEIRASYKQKDYGNLLGAIGNTPKMKNLQGSLQVIHNLRSEKGQEAHPGEPATDEDVTASRQALKKVATTCEQLLRTANGL